VKLQGTSVIGLDLGADIELCLPSVVLLSLGADKIRGDPMLDNRPGAP
jgi:hypothetical protein